MEEEYEMVISNYVDLEEESINASISHMVRDFRGYIDSFDARLALNRKLMSWLAAARLYSDRLAGHCCACLPNEDGIKERAESFFSAEHEKNFDYRFMVALRNYVQHYGTAVHQVMFGGRWTSLDTDGQLEFSSNFSADKAFLVADGHFKKQVVNEMPETVDLISASRGYMEGLSSIHNNARQIISRNVNEFRSLVQTAIDNYRTIYERDFVGLSAYVFDGDKKIDEIPIFLMWDDIRIQLQKRNGNLVNLKKRYVTGRIDKE